MGDGDAQRERDGGRRKHLIAVGNQEQQIGSHGPEAVCQGEHTHAYAFRHAYVRVRAQQALQTSGDRDTVGLDLADGHAELRRKMRGENDHLEIHFGVMVQIV